jgi:hypothetical protein
MATPTKTLEGFDLAWDLHERLGDAMENADGEKPAADLAVIKVLARQLADVAEGLTVEDYTAEYGGEEDEEESED